MLALAVLLALSPQNATQVALDRLRAQDATVADVSHNLAVKGASLCPQALAPKSGVKLHIKGQYGRADRADAVALFGLGEYPAVLAAVGEGPLRPGDWIVAIDGVDMRPPPGAADYAAVQKTEAALNKSRAEVVFVRSGARMSATLSSPAGCASDVELIPSRKLNAKADGRVVQVTTGVLAETRSDDELAFIIAHEMAHNILNHRERLDRIGRRTANIRETEIEADRLAVRLMHAAGYDPAAAASFWERFGKKTGAGIFSDGRHLRTAARVQLLRDEATKLAQ